MPPRGNPYRTASDSRSGSCGSMLSFAATAIDTSDSDLIEDGRLVGADATHRRTTSPPSSETQNSAAGQGDGAGAVGDQNA